MGLINYLGESKVIKRICQLLNVTDVKVDGTSVVDSNGVANIPAGGTDVDWNQVLDSGTKIAEITIDNGTPQEVFAPTPTEVVANPTGMASADLTKLKIGNQTFNVPDTKQFVDLTDVEIDTTTLADGQVPKWNNTTHKWENADETGLPHIELTQAEYDALSYAEKHNGAVYFITDAEGGSKDLAFIGLGECYSTEEKMVGCWIDGKPLYQKTIHIPNVQYDGNWHITQVNVNNYERLVSVFGTVVNTSNNSYPVNSYRVNSQMGITVEVEYIDTSTISVNYINTWIGASDYADVTIQYTKTTDTAGGSPWLPSSNYLPIESYVTTITTSSYGWFLPIPDKFGNPLTGKDVILSVDVLTVDMNNYYCFTPPIAYGSGNQQWIAKLINGNNNAIIQQAKQLKVRVTYIRNITPTF